METSSKDADLGQIQDFSISAHDVLTAFPLGIWLVAAVLAILSLAVVYFVHLTLAVGIFFIAIFDLFMFILFRHTTIAGAREKPTGHWRQREPDLGSVPAIYWMYILGSGGHTTEMLQAIKGHAKLNENAHRRYLFTSGDQNSRYHIQALERHFAWDHRLLSDGVGTSDICQIQRARSVHQSYLSSIFTSIRTVGDVIVALTKAPTKRPTSTYGDVFRYPKVIVTNGPGTGFIVCLVAHLLKMFYVIPESCCKVIYIETWAHVTSLSLTGKLFHWFDLADLYIVQHKPLAYKYGKYFLVVVDTPETRKARFQYPPSREDLVAMEQKSGAPDVAAKHRGQQL